MDPGEPILEAVDLHKRFKRGLFGPSVEALRGLSLRLGRGQALALIGPNGAGKSTAIRILMGLLHPDRGEVRLFGEAPTPEVRRKVGYVPQGLRLYPHLSPTELLSMVAGHLDLGAGQIRSEIRAHLKELDLWAVAERPIGELSGGQRQRVGLAQALLGDPSVLVLDEPLSGLDPAARRNAVALLQRRVEAGASLLISSHLLEEIEAMLRVLGGRSLALEDGRLRAAQDQQKFDEDE